MRKLFIILGVLAQVLVLCGMVFSRESVIHGGERIFLRTAPIDPRDPFRGDFVRLRYPMNNINNLSVQWSNPDYQPVKGDKVYAVLSDTIGSVHQAQYLTNEKPDSGLFIRGRVQSRKFAVSRFSANSLKFGIEQLFVQQGTGIDIENKQGLRGGLQVPMEVEVAVGKNGVAVLTDYRWSPLGVELLINENVETTVSGGTETVLDENSNADANNGANTNTNEQTNVTANSNININQNMGVSVRLENVSDLPIMLNNPGDDCGFSVVPSRIQDSDYEQADTECSNTVEPEFINLNSGEVYVLNIDLGNPRWYIQSETKAPFDLRTLAESEFFRIVYRSPPNTNTSENDAIWVGELPSRAFNSRGRVD